MSTYTQQELEAARTLVYELAPDDDHKKLAKEINGMRIGELSLKGDTLLGEHLRRLQSAINPAIDGDSLRTLLIAMTEIKRRRQG